MQMWILIIKLTIINKRNKIKNIMLKKNISQNKKIMINYLTIYRIIMNKINIYKYQIHHYLIQVIIHITNKKC
jgi:hypothetical protein